MVHRMPLLTAESHHLATQFVQVIRSSNSSSVRVGKDGPTVGETIQPVRLHL